MNIIRGKQNMKHNIKRALALFLALLLATPTFAFAEEPAGGIIMLDETPLRMRGLRFLILNRRARDRRMRLWNCPASILICPRMD